MQRLLFITILVSIAFQGGFVSAQESETDSPRSVYRAYSKASNAGNWPAVYATFSPGYRDFQLFECVFNLGMEGSPKSQELTEKFVDETKLDPSKNGFEQQRTLYETHQLVSNSIVNKKEMFLECMKHFELLGKKDATKKPKYGALKDLQMDNNVATGKASVTSSVVFYSRDSGDAKEVRNEDEVTTDIQMYFVKIDGRWLIATKNEWRTQNGIPQRIDGKRLFERLKTLEGQWRITQPARKTEVAFELIANGTVLVEKWRMSATRTSMTVYSLDNDRLLVTHYCPQGNAPRLVYQSTGDDGVHRFEFLDGLNLQDTSGSHQHAFWMRFNSEDSFTRSETYIKNGEKFDAAEHKDEPQTFERIK